MVKKIVTRLNSINDFSKKIIVVASIISFALCAIGICLVLCSSGAITLYMIGSNMIHTSIVLYAQFIVGSLFIDLVNTIWDKRDDD